YGNNDCFKNLGFQDPYTLAANNYNNGLDGLYPFVTVPAVQAGPWEWYDSTTVVNGANALGQNGVGIWSNSLLTNPDMSKTKALAYIDTVMNYLNPRIVYCLNLPTGVSDVESASSLIRISPNPATDYVRVDLSSLNTDVKSIQLLDVSGRIVKEVAATEKRAYDLSRDNLSSGTYFVKVILTSGEVNKKLVLQ
ncbi:MAG: T9SS type A sorting domain-containing protein, partial [Bacteroidota bacterium]